MSVPVTISASDVASAANFLEQLMDDQVPDGDFSKGTALRDLTINAIASVIAFLRADATQIRQMQSLVSVQAATGGDSEALSDAVTAILSNFLVTPKAGTLARGFAIGHSTQQVDMVIPINTRFTFTAGIIFVPDSTTTLLIQSTELTPVTDATGNVLDYEFRIPLVATATGTQYNIQPGTFASWDKFNPFVTRVEATSAFDGGNGQESVSAVLARAPTAVSVRNLINQRSIAATLDQNFPDIESVMVVGMGDPEMTRDTVPTLAPHLSFHVGGAVDIYTRTGLVETSFTGAVGGLFPRPDGVAAMFRDPSSDFVAAGVESGDILRIVGGLPSTPMEFLVESVLDSHALTVNERAPFPVATDEASPPTTVLYTIGRVPPAYVDVLSAIGGQPISTGLTSRQILSSGRITLPGSPVMDVLDVAIINPPGTESLFVNTLDGFVHFPNEVNSTPSQLATPSQGLQFQLVSHNPPYAQSALQWLDVVVGTDTFPSRFDGLNLRVRYRTLASFDNIDAFARGRDERITSAFQLPRGHNPVVVSMTMAYTLAATATTLLDNSAIANTVISYINGFDASAASIDVSSIIQLVKNTYPTIANIVPRFPGQPILTINYDLRAPTGDVLSFATNDVVDVDSAHQVAGPTAGNWTFQGQPVTLASLGVTPRTLRYVANSNTVIVLQQGT